MTELFTNINKSVKDTAVAAWRLALVNKNPAQAAEVLKAITDYYKHLYTQEEIEFLQFYFNMQMEMMKE